MNFLDLYIEGDRVYFQIEGTKKTNDFLDGIYLSWRFSDYTMRNGGMLESLDGGELALTPRVAGEHFVSRPFRATLDAEGDTGVAERLAADGGAMFRLCFVYPTGRQQLQCFETPAADIMEGPPPIPGISQTLPTVTIPRSLFN